jgi:hypothetical protein
MRSFDGVFVLVSTSPGVTDQLPPREYESKGEHRRADCVFFLRNFEFDASKPSVRKRISFHAHEQVHFANPLQASRRLRVRLHVEPAREVAQSNNAKTFERGATG